MVLQAAGPGRWGHFSPKCGAGVRPVQCEQRWLSEPRWKRPSATCHCVSTARARTACGCSLLSHWPPAPGQPRAQHHRRVQGDVPAAPPDPFAQGVARAACAMASVLPVSPFLGLVGQNIPRRLSKLVIGGGVENSWSSFTGKLRWNQLNSQMISLK